MYTDADIDIINRGIATSPKDRSTLTGINAVADAYKVVFGTEMCRGCRNEANVGYNKLIAYFRRSTVIHNQINIPMKKTFILKKGFLIRHPETSELYTNSNITDDIAREMIKINPDLKGRFEQVGEVEHKEEKQEEKQEDTQHELDQASTSDAVNYLQQEEITKREMQDIARERGYDTSEWKKMSKEDLRTYLINKA